MSVTASTVIIDKARRHLSQKGIQPVFPFPMSPRILGDDHLIDDERGFISNERSELIRGEGSIEEPLPLEALPHLERSI